MGYTCEQMIELIESLDLSVEDKEIYDMCKLLIDGSIAITEIPAILSENMTDIRQGAFANCPLLALASIPNSVKSIGEDAFLGCSSLALTSLPEGLEIIEFRAFYGCSSLVNIILPNSLTFLGNYTF